MENKNKIFKFIKGIFICYILFLSFLSPIFSNSLGWKVDGSGQMSNREVANLLCGAPIDVKDSFFLSAGSLCLTGVIGKLLEYQEIQCRYVQCAYNAVVYNSEMEYDQTFDSKCDAYRSYQTCTYILGELSALPFVGFVEQIRKLIYDFLTNPLSVAVSVIRATVVEPCVKAIGATKVGKVATTTNTAGKTINPCQSHTVGIAGLTLMIIDYPYIVNRLENLGNTQIFDFESVSTCSELETIKEELEKIIEEYEANFESDSDDDSSDDDDDDSLPNV